MKPGRNRVFRAGGGLGGGGLDTRDTQEPEPESRRGDYTKYATGQ